MEQKIIFKSKGSYLKFSFYLVLCTIILVYLSFQIQENPPVIIVIMAFLGFVILSSSIDKIIVYEDSFVLEYKRLIGFLSTRNKYLFDEIASIDADLQLTQKSDAIANTIMGITHFIISVWNKITITYKSGKSKTIGTKIYKDAFTEAFKYIEKSSKIKITIIDRSQTEDIL